MRWPTDNGAVRKGGTSSFRVHNERHANSCLGSSGVNANVPTSAPSSAFSGGFFARVWTAPDTVSNGSGWRDGHGALDQWDPEHTGFDMDQKERNSRIAPIKRKKPVRVRLPAAQAS